MVSKPNKGDLIEYNGKRWVVSGFIGRCSQEFVHAIPATKKGQTDKRYEGQYVPWHDCKLIRAATA